jgi:hypothetical protein
MRRNFALKKTFCPIVPSLTTDHLHVTIDYMSNYSYNIELNNDA